MIKATRFFFFDVDTSNCKAMISMIKATRFLNTFPITIESMHVFTKTVHQPTPQILIRILYAFIIYRVLNFFISLHFYLYFTPIIPGILFPVIFKFEGY